MRAVTAEEIEYIAGGLAKRHPGVTTLTQTLSTITVTGTSPGGGILPVGGGGGGGVGGSPVDGIGDGDPGAGGPPTEQEWENLAETAVELAENGVLGSDTTIKLFATLDYAKLAANINSTQYQYGVDDYNIYENTDGNMHYPPGYEDFVHWDRINWNSYDEGGTATAQEAIANLFNDIDANHHVAFDPAS